MIEKIEIATSVVFGIIGIAAAVYKNYKHKKTIKLAQIVQRIPQHIIEAEETGAIGAVKLAMVIHKVHIECLESNIKFNENQIKEEVEKILETPQKKEI